MCVCQKRRRRRRKKRRIRLLPPAIITIMTIISIDFFVPFFFLSSMTVATSLCHSHPVFLKNDDDEKARTTGERLGFS